MLQKGPGSPYSTNSIKLGESPARTQVCNICYYVFQLLKTERKKSLFVKGFFSDMKNIYEIWSTQIGQKCSNCFLWKRILKSCANFYFLFFSSLIRWKSFRTQWKVLGLAIRLSLEEENANFAKTMVNPRINSVATFCEIQTLVNWFVLSSGRKFAKCVEPLETKPTPEIIAPKIRKPRKTGNSFLNKATLCKYSP